MSAFGASKRVAKLDIARFVCVHWGGVGYVSKGFECVCLGVNKA